MVSMICRWLVTGLVCLVAGCYEDPQAVTVTLHQPHVYKGKPDLHEYDHVWQHDLLKVRFQLGQTDR